MSKEDLDLQQWIPATMLNEKDRFGLVTEVLILSVKMRGPEFTAMESLEPNMRKNRPFNCLVRTHIPIDKLPEGTSPAISLVGPIELLLGSLIEWGILPEQDEKESNG